MKVGAKLFGFTIAVACSIAALGSHSPLIALGEASASTPESLNFCHGQYKPYAGCPGAIGTAQCSAATDQGMAVCNKYEWLEILPNFFEDTMSVNDDDWTWGFDGQDDCVIAHICTFGSGICYDSGKRDLTKSYQKAVADNWLCELGGGQ
jgi:hypothetical protein